MLDLYRRGGVLMWPLTAALVFILYFALHLMIVAVRRGREASCQVGSSELHDKELLDRLIFRQRTGFYSLLFGLRILGVLVPFLGLVSLISNLIRVSDSLAASASWEVALFASGISELLIGFTTAVMLTALCWTIYFIFSFILQRRILYLEKLKLDPS